MKKYIPHLLFVLLVAGTGLATAIKTWTTGEILRSTDLNSNFSHIHNTMVGGHGARLVDADVSASAAIAHTKMATPALLPKAKGTVEKSPLGSGLPCDATCVIEEGVGITSVTRTGAGSYDVTLTTARANSAYFGLVTGTRQAQQYCDAVPSTTTVIAVRCVDATGAATDTRFSIVIFDSDN